MDENEHKESGLFLARLHDKLARDLAVPPLALDGVEVHRRTKKSIRILDTLRDCLEEIYAVQFPRWSTEIYYPPRIERDKKESIK